MLGPRPRRLLAIPAKAIRPILPLEKHAMSGPPIRKDELALLETMGRGQPLSNPDETALERMDKAGLIASRGGKWSITERGKMELTRRKALGRSATRR